MDVKSNIRLKPDTAARVTDWQARILQIKVQAIGAEPTPEADAAGRPAGLTVLTTQVPQ